MTLPSFETRKTAPGNNRPSPFAISESAVAIPAANGGSTPSSGAVECSPAHPAQSASEAAQTRHQPSFIGELLVPNPQLGSQSAVSQQSAMPLVRNPRFQPGVRGTPPKLI